MEGDTGSRPGASLVDFRAECRLYAALRMRDSLEAMGILTSWGCHLIVSYMRDKVVEGVHMRWQR